MNKQETLEEAALKYASEKLKRIIIPYQEFNANVAEYVGFVNGAKWQQEQDKWNFTLDNVRELLKVIYTKKQKRSYSEEEVIDFLQEMNDWPTTFEGRIDIREWFKQFKNK